MRAGTAVRLPTTGGGGGSNPVVGLNFQKFSATRYYNIFLLAKNRFLREKFGFFVKWALFLKNYPFSDVKEKNVLFKIFEKFRNIFQSAEKPKKS